MRPKPLARPHDDGAGHRHDEHPRQQVPPARYPGVHVGHVAQAHIEVGRGELRRPPDDGPDRRVEHRRPRRQESEQEREQRERERRADAVAARSEGAAAVGHHGVVGRQAEGEDARRGEGRAATQDADGVDVGVVGVPLAVEGAPRNGDDDEDEGRRHERADAGRVEHPRHRGEEEGEGLGQAPQGAVRHERHQDQQQRRRRDEGARPLQERAQVRRAGEGHGLHRGEVRLDVLHRRLAERFRRLRRPRDRGRRGLRAAVGGPPSVGRLGRAQDEQRDGDELEGVDDIELHGEASRVPRREAAEERPAPGCCDGEHVVGRDAAVALVFLDNSQRIGPEKKKKKTGKWGLSETYEVSVVNGAENEAVERSPAQALEDAGPHARAETVAGAHVPHGTNEDEHHGYEVDRPLAPDLGGHEREETREGRDDERHGRQGRDRRVRDAEPHAEDAVDAHVSRLHPANQPDSHHQRDEVELLLPLRPVLGEREVCECFPVPYLIFRWVDVVENDSRFVEEVVELVGGRDGG
ncbi:hypothetical protein CSUB01_10014 [Colletotrichum sublineola]|uniref:Uncharacterized protein n=1 Tax=Colletotrichum sublineola TaxID=1173701 RepID=A0A066WZ55_COLSU|nr:hypothetical protein CSUB01_10014 [Colletotrichum sublineola]